MLYAHLRRQVFYAVNRPIPYDVFNVDVVANECVDVVVDVDYSNKSIALYAEIVKERRVLTEWIVSIVGKIAWWFVVAKNDNHTTLYQLFKFGTPTDVSFLAEHDN